uniref:Uncharacterized protein n=1 Tax=Panagrellus redivivus TaxID=6233 RepID=A0A7E4W7Q7_PANRE
MSVINVQHAVSCLRKAVIDPTESTLDATNWLTGPTVPRGYVVVVAVVPSDFPMLPCFPPDKNVCILRLGELAALYFRGMMQVFGWWGRRFPRRSLARFERASASAEAV